MGHLNKSRSEDDTWLVCVYDEPKENPTYLLKNERNGIKLQHKFGELILIAIGIRLRLKACTKDQLADFIVIGRHHLRVLSDREKKLLKLS